MKRRDYELIASAMRAEYHRHSHAPCVHRDYCEAIADAFACEKPGFDRDLFLTNCGVQENER